MKKENLFYLFVLISLLFISACKKEEEGVTVDKSKSYQAILNQYVGYGLTGISVSISSPGQVPFNGAAGYADIDNKIPMTTSHVFSAASIPKSFVAIVILKLIEEGKLSLDSKISDYLDEDVKAMVVNVDKITVRQLLNHTSGLPDVINEEYIADLNADPGRYYTLKELLNYIKGKDAISEPGKAYSYTDTNYILLYLIIGKITDNPLDALKNHIMSPLGTVL
jgi:D-alanyl-D-alanine carboxypeptidase